MMRPSCKVKTLNIMQKYLIKFSLFILLNFVTIIYAKALNNESNNRTDNNDSIFIDTSTITFENVTIHSTIIPVISETMQTDISSSSSSSLQTAKSPENDTKSQIMTPQSSAKNLPLKDINIITPIEVQIQNTTITTTEFNKIPITSTPFPFDVTKSTTRTIRISNVKNGSNYTIEEEKEYKSTENKIQNIENFHNISQIELLTEPPENIASSTKLHQIDSNRYNNDSVKFEKILTDNSDIDRFTATNDNMKNDFKKFSQENSTFDKSHSDYDIQQVVDDIHNEKSQEINSNSTGTRIKFSKLNITEDVTNTTTTLIQQNDQFSGRKKSDSSINEIKSSKSIKNDAITNISTLIGIKNNLNNTNTKYTNPPYDQTKLIYNVTSSTKLPHMQQIEKQKYNLSNTNTEENSLENAVKIEMITETNNYLQYNNVDITTKSLPSTKQNKMLQLPDITSTPFPIDQQDEKGMKSNLVIETTMERNQAKNKEEKSTHFEENSKNSSEKNQHLNTNILYKNVNTKTPKSIEQEVILLTTSPSTESYVSTSDERLLKEMHSTETNTHEESSIQNQITSTESLSSTTEAIESSSYSFMSLTTEELKDPIINSTTSNQSTEQEIHSFLSSTLSTFDTNTITTSTIIPKIPITSQSVEKLISTSTSLPAKAISNESTKKPDNIFSIPTIIEPNILDHYSINTTINNSNSAYTTDINLFDYTNGSMKSIPEIFPTKSEVEQTTVLPPYFTTINNDIFLTEPMYNGSNFSKEVDYNVIIAISVSVVGIIALILLVGFLYVVKRRQKQLTYGQRCRPVSLDAYSLDNVSVYNSVRRKGTLRLSKRSYGNIAFDDPSLKHNLLNIQELMKFAERKSSIHEEFRNIPQIIVGSEEVPVGCEDRNRYANVIPIPETRVVLQRQNDDEKTEYINANYVRGPNDSTNYYIACQAPLESTVADFWRMIWEQNSRVIIMATDLIENGIEKCSEYLPASVTLDNRITFGNFQIMLKSREVKEKYVVSTLHLKNTVTNVWREITHFWYQWPETGVPNDEASIIAMLLESRSCLKSLPIDQMDSSSDETCTEQINNSDNNKNVEKLKTSEKLQGPLTVHCSPGTGRTGTIITCDIVLRTLEKPKRSVDIPQIVYYVRRARASSVQTKDQYEIIYKVAKIYAEKISGTTNEN